MTENKKKASLAGVLLVLAIPLAAALAGGAIYYVRVKIHESQGGTQPYRSKTPEEWVELMHNPDPGNRGKARSFFIQYGDEALPYIEELLKEAHNDPARLEALRAANDLKHISLELAPLIRDTLADRTFEDRDVAAHVLVAIGDDSTEAENALIKALDSDPDTIVQIAAAKSLGEIAKTPDSVETLARISKQEPSSTGGWEDLNEMYLKKAAVKALENIAEHGPEEVASAARDALN